jgi:hypothetical protein
MRLKIMENPDLAVWHNDGHSISLRIENSELVILEVNCPDEEAACAHRKVGCIVKHFISRYGMDCNVGSAAPHPEMEIAWHLTGDADDLESCQVWFIPSQDEAFAAWVESQKS